MERGTRQSFILSLVIHGVFAGMAVLFIFIESWFEEPEPVVFELVAAASPAAAETPTEAPATEPELPEPIRVDEPEPLRPPPEVPDLPEPEPEPEPVRKLSFEEWARNRELPERVQRVRRERERPMDPVPEIETDVRSRLEEQLSQIQVEGINLDAVQSTDPLQRYLSALRRRIQDRFEPGGSDLEAEVFFTVTADGRLTGARIQRSSGNPAFDQSVLRTLWETRPPGRPPGDRDFTFSLVFRSE